jgi:hypothetical protein
MDFRMEKDEDLALDHELKEEFPMMMGMLV